jgi:anti-anti-sigma factor
MDDSGQTRCNNESRGIKMLTFVQPRRHILTELVAPVPIHISDVQLVQGRSAAFSTRTDGTELVVSISGDFDLAAVIDVGERLRVATSGLFTSLSLHLSDVAFMDSSGASAIAEIASKLRVEDKPVRLRSASRSVLKVLRLLGIDRLISSDPHLNEWRPMIPSTSLVASPSRSHAFIRANTAGQVAARNRDAREQTDDARVRNVAPAASRGHSESASAAN